MIDTDKYEGHTQGPWHIENEENNGMRLFICSKGATILWQCETTHADALLIADAPLLLEFIEKVAEEWARPNACPKSFGKEVRSLLLEYGLINFNEETRRYEVNE